MFSLGTAFQTFLDTGRPSWTEVDPSQDYTGHHNMEKRLLSDVIFVDCTGFFVLM